MEARHHSACVEAGTERQKIHRWTTGCRPTPGWTFEVEKAYFGSVPLPAFFVQKMIEVVATRQPEHYDTSKPVPLPFGLRKSWTGDKVVMGEN